MCVHCTVQYITVYSGGCVMVRPGPEPRLEPRCHSGRGRESRQSPSDTETSQTQTQTQRIQSTHIHPSYTTFHSVHPLCQPLEVVLQPHPPASAQSTASMELKRKIRRKVKVVIADKSFS